MYTTLGAPTFSVDKYLSSSMHATPSSLYCTAWSIADILLTATRSYETRIQYGLNHTDRGASPETLSNPHAYIGTSFFLTAKQVLMTNPCKGKK